MDRTPLSRLVFSFVLFLILASCSSSPEKNLDLLIDISKNIRPDLSVRNLELDDQKRIRFKIVNTGNLPIPKNKIHFRVAVDENYVKNYQLEDTAATLEAGDEQVFQTNIRLAGRMRRVLVVLDPDNTLPEINEFQNVRARTLKVQHCPVIITDNQLEDMNCNNLDGSDLQPIQAEWVTTDSNHQLQVTVKNTGNTSFDGNFDLHIKSDTGETFQLNNQPLNLLADQQQSFAVPIELPLAELNSLHRFEIHVETDVNQDLDVTNNQMIYWVYPANPNQTEAQLLEPYLTLIANPKIQSALNWQDYNLVLDSETETHSAVALQKPYSTWTDAQKTVLNEAILKVEHGRSPLDSPPTPAKYSNGGVIIPSIADNFKTKDDAFATYAGFVAHSLWVEVRNKVSWSLLDDDVEHLRFLFDARRFIFLDTIAKIDLSKFKGVPYSFRCYAPNELSLTGSSAASSADNCYLDAFVWNPRIFFFFLQNTEMIQLTQKKTAMKFTDWARSYFYHGVGYTDYNGEDGSKKEYTVEFLSGLPIESMLYPRKSISRITSGCWGATSLYAGVLRTANLAVERDRTQLKSIWSAADEELVANIHSRLILRFSGDEPHLTLAHGDDLYSPYLRPWEGKPASSEIFMTETLHDSLLKTPTAECAPIDTAPLGKDSLCQFSATQSLKNHQKFQLELASNVKGLSYLDFMTVPSKATKALVGEPGALECSDNSDLSSCSINTPSTSIPLCTASGICIWKEKYGIYFFNPVFTSTQRDQLFAEALQKVNSLPAYYFDSSGFREDWIANLK